MGYTSNRWTYRYGYAQVGLTADYAGEDDSSVVFTIAAALDMVNAYQYGARLAINTSTGQYWTATGARPSSAGLVAALGPFGLAVPKGAQPYTFAVRADGMGEIVNGYSAYQGGVSTQQNYTIPALADADTPGAPTVTGTGNTRTVTCKAVKNATSYELQYSTDDFVNYQRMTVQPDTQIVVTLGRNGRYRFRYTVKGPSGVVKTGAVSPYQYTVLADPVNLTVTTVQTTKVQLYWTKMAPYADGTRIFRATSSSGPWTQVATATAAPYIDSPVPGPVYYYRVQNYRSSDVSGYSNVATVQTMTTPASPSGLTRNTPTDSNTAVLSWTNNQTTQGPYSSIKIYRRYEGEASYTLIDTISGTLTTFSTAITPSRKVYYYLVATNAAGDSPASNTLTTYSQIYAPSNLDVPSFVPVSTGFNFTLSWNKPATNFTEGTYTYTMYESVNSGSWVSIGTTTSTSAALTRTYPMGDVNYRVMATVTNLVGSETRTTGYSNTIDQDVEQSPSTPSITFNPTTLMTTWTIPPTQYAIVSPVTTKLFVDGIDSGVSVSSGANGTTYNYQYVPTKSTATLQLRSSYAYFDQPIFSESIVADIDTAPVFIDGIRYSVLAIDSTGTRICSVSAI